MPCAHWQERGSAAFEALPLLDTDSLDRGALLLLGLGQGARSRSTGSGTDSAAVTRTAQNIVLGDSTNTPPRSSVLGLRQSHFRLISQDIRRGR